MRDGGHRTVTPPPGASIDLDLFDVTRNVVGPFTYSFSFYQVMPQLGGPAPAIQRGAINAAYPPAATAQPPNSLRFASFNVENYFPAGEENDGHVITGPEYAERTDAIVKAVRGFLHEPDVIAVQEAAVFADGANALTGLAQALGNYTGYITTNNDARGIAPGFLVKNGVTASNPRLVGDNVDFPATGAACDLRPGTLYDRRPFGLDISKGDLAATVVSNHFASQGHEDACRIAEADHLRGQPFVPGVGTDYTATLAASVTSTAADAALSVADPSTNATGRLVNGAFALVRPLQLHAGGNAFAPLHTDSAPLPLTSWSGPVSNAATPIGVKQTIGADEGLRTGRYGKTITFTLWTTNP